MPVELLSGCLRYRRAIVSGALGSVIAASWAYLWLGGGQIMAMPSEWSVPYAALIFVMWVDRRVTPGRPCCSNADARIAQSCSRDQGTCGS